MERAITTLLFLLLCPASLPAQSSKQLLLGLASISGGIDLLHVTKKTGAFKRNGLDVDFILFQGGSQALQVLLAGDVKMISGGGGTAAQRGSESREPPCRHHPTMPFSLTSTTKSRRQTVRSKIAILGSSSDFAARCF
jgi:ABC-type nitrate/sulfonate/bicarbonate transport system substrate-binding protein